MQSTYSPIFWTSTHNFLSYHANRPTIRHTNKQITKLQTRSSGVNNNANHLWHYLGRRRSQTGGLGVEANCSQCTIVCSYSHHRTLDTHTRQLDSNNLIQFMTHSVLKLCPKDETSICQHHLCFNSLSSGDLPKFLHNSVNFSFIKCLIK